MNEELYQYTTILGIDMTGGLILSIGPNYVGFLPKDEVQSTKRFNKKRAGWLEKTPWL